MRILTTPVSRRTLGLATLGAATLTILNSESARASDAPSATPVEAATPEESKAFLLSMMPTVEQFKTNYNSRAITANRDVAQALAFVDEGISAIGKTPTDTPSAARPANLTDRSLPFPIFPGEREVVRGAVAAMYLYFTNRHFYLAANYLNHAINNRILDSRYTPPMARSIILRTAEWRIKSRNKSPVGNGSFPAKGKLEDLDAYYSIHSYQWTTSRKHQRIILDRYDFENRGEYSSWRDLKNLPKNAGVAVCVRAQELHIL